MVEQQYKKIVEGIPHLSEDRYWGKAPKEELEKALQVLEEKGWQEFEKQFSKKFDFTFEENRADFRFMIPVTKQSIILDAGAGMGRISIPLARVAGKIISVENSFLRAKFLKKRATHEKLSNIEVFVGDLFDLDYPEETFDCIVMNGLLEWIGMTDRFSRPRQAQLAALNLCKKMLKKGGYLYIGIENRHALSYLSRGVDHSGLRYTSFMPRFLADWYTRARKGRPYNTYTYNKYGYQKLLSDAGFATSDFYLVYPGYNSPRILVPYDNLTVFSYVIRMFMSERSWEKRLIRRIAQIRPLLWLYRWFFFSFSIYAKK